MASVALPPNSGSGTWSTTSTATLGNGASMTSTAGSGIFTTNTAGAVGAGITITSGQGSNIVLNGGTGSFVTWQPFLTRSKTMQPLENFFSDGLHGLLCINDAKAHIIPFKDSFGMIWLQNDVNKWGAYDKEAFFEFINDDEIKTFDAELSPDEVILKLSDPNNGPHKSGNPETA